MKKLFVLLLLQCNFCFAQSDEARQLLLNVEKLAQFKKILQNMKDGYQVIHKGYTSIKNISEDNFSLHNIFLHGLLDVSPAVKRYKRVADIIQYQLKIVKEYKGAFLQFKESKQFTMTEIAYIGKVYSNLFNEVLKNMEELAMVITSGKLRMSDDERLNAIDKIYGSVLDQYTFLNEFNNNTAILSLQREKDKMDIDLMKKVHGLR